MLQSTERAPDLTSIQSYGLVCVLCPVRDPVSRPQVSSRNKMNPTCSVLCSVQNGREVTLSWQREGETLNQTSSPDLSTLLSLPLEIEYNSAPYSCVVKNPGSNQKVTVKAEEYCYGETL
ncbi:hypothetical protein AAFF_G00342000 [Aldrovandia affinis]|uniref:Ig-like domain-containing protein n=1 Tax=Aldrovandia affinis TaxID=143900 RepID=A0AAD7VZV8_9TELE|nr:hypothetical protein AAFF_G00342000 [Aldrovandia affinis]